ncbi:hypothetical protein OC846_004007 [Tilletia horrida]|uniref:Zn(2)-C6 fungal-type domain-containing protein n=1 Tax=Tilletia horrida TaxID=155126 RepID=A0AAN6GNK1_9BASI|nr:hypothetical protein OC846_004007 [Tilletia horrida]
MEPAQDTSTASRVLVDGPGGDDVKQGARIACDNCRQAKIRCSAPTDGNVPCNRCIKAQKPCLFYKHQRGRKPGRLNNRKKKDPAAAGPDDSHYPGDDSEDDDGDDSMAFADTPGPAPKHQNNASPSKSSASGLTRGGGASSGKNAAGSRSSMGAAGSKSAASKARLSGPISSQNPLPLSVPLLPLPSTGQKRKRASNDFRPQLGSSSSPFPTHGPPSAGSSPNFHSTHLARVPSPAPSRASTVGSTSAANNKQRNQRAGSTTSVLNPPALLERTSLSASASGSGTASRTGSRRGSPNSTANPASPQQNKAHYLPSASSQHTSQANRNASPEEAAIAANSLLWYSGATSAAPPPNTISSSSANRMSASYPQASNHAQDGNSNAATNGVAPDVSAFANAGLFDPNNFMTAYSNLDYERQRLLQPLYQVASQNLEPNVAAAATLAMTQAQPGQSAEWQKRLQEQMRQASYGPQEIAAASAAVEQISNVLVQQTQQHQQQAVQQLLAKSAAMQGSDYTAHHHHHQQNLHIDTQSTGPGHMTIPTQSPHGQFHSPNNSNPPAHVQQQHRGLNQASNSPPGSRNYASSSARANGPTSAPLPGMPGYPVQFALPSSNSSTSTPGGTYPSHTVPHTYAHSAHNSQFGQAGSSAAAATAAAAATPNMMPPPPPRHSNSFLQGYDATQGRSHPGALGSGSRSGSYNEGLQAAGKMYLGHMQGSGGAAQQQQQQQQQHSRSQSMSSIYETGGVSAGSGGYGHSQAPPPPPQQQQQQFQHHGQLHMSGGKAFHATGGNGGAGPAAGQNPMPPFVHGARGVNRMTPAQHLKAAGGDTQGLAGAGAMLSPPGLDTSAAAAASAAGAANGDVVSRLRSLSNESGNGSAGEGPSMKRARLEGNVSMHPPRPIDEEEEEEEVQDDDAVKMEDGGAGGHIGDGGQREGGEDDEELGDDEDDEEDDDDDDEDEDEIEDYEDGFSDDDSQDPRVLSNPLKLLAKASSAAANMDSSKRYRTAAETMGLLCVRPNHQQADGSSEVGQQSPAATAAAAAAPGGAPSPRPVSDYYGSSRNATATAARLRASPHARGLDMNSIPSLVRNPPGSTSAAATSGISSVAPPHPPALSSGSVGGGMPSSIRVPPPPTDELSWVLGPRRMTSGVAALVGLPRRFTRHPPPPGPPPLQDRVRVGVGAGGAGAGRSVGGGQAPLPSSFSDSALGGDSSLHHTYRVSSSSHVPNGLAVAAASRGESLSASLRERDEGGARAGLAALSHYQRRPSRQFESSASRSTGSIGDADPEDGRHERSRDYHGFGNRAILSDTRRTSMGGAGGGVGLHAGAGRSSMPPQSPIQQSMSQPLPVRTGGLTQPGGSSSSSQDGAELAEADRRLGYSQPEPLTKDERHGVVTAKSLWELTLQQEGVEERRPDTTGVQRNRVSVPAAGAIAAHKSAAETAASEAQAAEAKDADAMDVDKVQGKDQATDQVVMSAVASSEQTAAAVAPATETAAIAAPATATASGVVGEASDSKVTPNTSMDVDPTSLKTPDRAEQPASAGNTAPTPLKTDGTDSNHTPAMSPPVRRRRNSHSNEAGKDVATVGGVFPSPVQQEYLEYRDGRIQTRRAKGGSVSSGAGVPFQGLSLLLPGLGEHRGKAHTVAGGGGGLTPAMKPSNGPVNAQSPSPAAGDTELLPPPMLTRFGIAFKKQPKSWVSFSGVDSSPLNDAFGRRKKGKDKKDKMKKKKSTAGMTDMSSRSKFTQRTRLMDDGKDEILPNMDDDESDAGNDGFKRNYFNVSLFHQKLDIDSEELDPIANGNVQPREMERLFDVFINSINPLLLVFDPVLHSMEFVRSRSAFLTTVVASLAARFVDTQRDAELAVYLEKLWREQQLPHILTEGYKSVEIAQAFIILAMYHKPTRSLADDRSWQYLGFAIRMATEIGVNRRLNPKESFRSREPIRRRLRNRERLWANLFLCDRIMSAQTGRPWTISDDLLWPELSTDWHTHSFALPADAVVVSMIRLRRLVARHSTDLDKYLSKEYGALKGNQQALSYLEFLRHSANSDLERWRDSWMSADNSLQLSDPQWGPFSTHWVPISKLYYQHSWLHLNSYVLQAIEKAEGVSSTVYKDCWVSGLEVVKITLEHGEAKLMYAPNHTIVMAVYSAVSVLRMLNLDKAKHPWIDRDEAIKSVRALTVTLNNAGKTPLHRNGAAVPYAKYLTSVLALWEPPAAEPNPPPMAIAEENKKSKDPPRVSTESRLRSQSDAAALRRPHIVSNNAIIMPSTNTEVRARKPDRNSLGATTPGPSSLNTNTAVPLLAPGTRPSTSAAAEGASTMTFATMPLSSTPEAIKQASVIPFAGLRPHPHPIGWDSLEAWAGGVNAMMMPTTPTGGAYNLNRVGASAPITALSTPALGADNSGDMSGHAMDISHTSNGQEQAMAGTNAQATASLGPAFGGLDMSGVGGLNVAGINMPQESHVPFLMTGPIAPSTSSTAAAAPGSAGPTMMRVPHQQRQQQQQQQQQHQHQQQQQGTGHPGMPNSFVVPHGVPDGNAAGNAMQMPLTEGFLDDANWTFPAATTTLVDGTTAVEAGSYEAELLQCE